MGIGCWVHYCGGAPEREKNSFAIALVEHGVEILSFTHGKPNGPGVCLFDEMTGQLRDFLQSASCDGRERASLPSRGPKRYATAKKAGTFCGQAPRIC